MPDATNYDANAEKSVLAACLLSKRARDTTRQIITGSDFYDQDHEVIWDVMANQDRNGDNVDATIVFSRLTEARASRAITLMADLATWPTVTEHVADHAKTIRDWSTRRALIAEAIRTQQLALNPEYMAGTLIASVVTRFNRINEAVTSDDVLPLTADEVLSSVDTEPDWVIPGLLERRDRLMLTGVEGLGKSFLLRQIAILASAGLHPFTSEPIPPIRTLVVDCENSMRQIRRSIRPVAAFAERYGQGAMTNTSFWPIQRIDIAGGMDLARIHQTIDKTEPDLVVIGPLYRLVPRALQTDDEAAPVLAALDTIRERGITLLIEAHAGHALSKTGVRDLRPRGSSALLGWPEFGYGMRDTEDGDATLRAWRGDRDARDWPQRLRRSVDGDRWIPDERPEDDVIHAVG